MFKHFPLFFVSYLIALCGTLFFAGTQPVDTVSHYVEQQWLAVLIATLSIFVVLYLFKIISGECTELVLLEQMEQFEQQESIYSAIRKYNQLAFIEQHPEAKVLFKEYKVFIENDNNPCFVLSFEQDGKTYYFEAAHQYYFKRLSTALRFAKASYDLFVDPVSVDETQGEIDKLGVRYFKLVDNNKWRSTLEKAAH